MYFSSVSRTQIDQTKTKVKLENMAAILVSLSVEQLDFKLAAYSR
jgi:hypothetical protein